MQQAMKLLNWRTWRTAIALLPLALLNACANKDDYSFADYEQILPRGAIAAITEPEYVNAEQAEIDDDSYVLGIIIDGQPRAYSLNLLNSHEVVNDKIGDQAYAAVW
jgi:hypothetical protein